MIPPSSQSSPPQQQQQADSSSTLQSSTLPQTQTGAQQLQVTFCSFISLFLWPYCSINFLLSIFMLAFFLKIVYFLWIHNSHYRGCSFFFSFHSSLLHAAYSCMTFSLGPMIQVLLSCLLHSTQSIYTSSIRPRASLFCRYSTEDKPNVCGCMYVGQV